MNHQEKIDEMLNKMRQLSEEQLQNAVGGAGQSYSLTVNGVLLTQEQMNTTIGVLCQSFEGLREKLGPMYSLVSGMTPNQLCAIYGQDTIQSLITDNT